MDEIANDVDASIKALGITVECVDLLDDLSAATSVAVQHLILRSNSLCEIIVCALDGQHAVRQIVDLILPFATCVSACWDQ